MASSSPDADKKLSPVDREVGLALRNLRIARGLSQAELAAQIGVGAVEIENHELGLVRIDVRRLIDLAHALQAPVSAFWSGIRGAGR